MNPDERCAVAQLKVQRLEAALAAFGEESSPEKAVLEEFLVRARAQAKVRPIEERVKSCEEYLQRSLKKLEEVKEEVERTKARLVRLKEEAASALPRPVEMAPDLEAEVVRLRAELAEARGERPRVRQRVVEPMPQREQELWDWMSSKQQELRDVLEFGGSRNVVLELTSKLVEAAERLHTLQNRDDVVM